MIELHGIEKLLKLSVPQQSDFMHLNDALIKWNDDLNEVLQTQYIDIIHTLE